MIKRVLALAAILFVATAGVAHAGDYSSEDALTTDTASVAPGGHIVITAHGFAGEVTFTLRSDPVVLGTATANSEGVAVLDAVIPANTTPGTHTIEATGVDPDGNPRTQTTTIEVTGTSGELPQTGSDSTLPLAQIGLGAVVLGGFLVILASKRRHTEG